jgi:UDP-glucose 4-epimerase
MDSRTPVIVAGGAGYIGSHMVRMLREQGYRPIVVDNLSTGHADAVQGAELHQGDIGDAAFMAALLRETRPACVMHFAASSLVGESMQHPGKYWRNNLVQTLSLLDTLVAAQVPRFIFSSTAAVYGNPQQVPIPEDHPTQPINPYGHSKLAVEHLLQDYEAAHGLRHIVLRYFNAAGAHPEGSLGERHEPETHLIPLVLRAAAGGVPLKVFGDDYPTPDGTCIRDYIHVSDLADAHVLGLERLLAGGDSTVYNLGNGQGFSVKEVISTAERVTGRKVPHSFESRREGDPPALVGSAERARIELGWSPRFADLESMIATAHRFHEGHALTGGHLG